MSLEKRPLGTEKEDKAYCFTQEIIDNFLKANYENVINRAQLLNEIPIGSIKNPSIIADALLECLYSLNTDPKRFYVLCEIGDHSMLIIFKIALHFYIVALSRGIKILENKQYLLEIPLNKTENRICIEIKYLKYLFLNQNNLQDILEEQGMNTLQFVGSLGLSKVMELRQNHLCKGTPIFKDFNAIMKNSLIGRYLILICLRQKCPQSSSLRLVQSMIGFGWKTLYRILEISTVWCLKRNIEERKFDNVLTRIIIPLAKCNHLSTRYNWRVREKAIACLTIVDSIKNLSFVLKQIKTNERDRRVLQIFKNKASARHDIGHTVWKYKKSKYYEGKQCSEEETFNISRYFIAREEELNEITAKIETKGKMVSIIGCAGIGKTALAKRSIEILRENKILENNYKDGLLFIRCDNDPVVRFSKYDCNLAPTDSQLTSLGQYLLEISEDTLVLLDSTDCLKAYQVRQIVSQLKGNSIIITSRRRTDCFTSSRIDLKAVEEVRCKQFFKKITNHEVGLYMRARLGGFPLAICDMARYTRKLIYNGDQEAPRNYHIADKWLKNYMNRNSVKLQLKSAEIEFNTSFVIRESLNVLPESSIILLGILGSMAFDYFRKEHIEKSFWKGLKELVKFNLIIKEPRGYKLSHNLLFRYAYFNLKSRFFFCQLNYFVDFIRRRFIKKDKNLNNLIWHALRIQKRAFEEGYYREVVCFAGVFGNLEYKSNLSQIKFWFAKRGLKASKMLKDIENQIIHLCLIGLSYQGMHKNSEAIKMYDEALRLNANRNYLEEEDILTSKAVSLFDIGMVNKSIHFFKRSFEIAQKKGSMLILAINNLYLGNIHFHMGHVMKAAENYEESMSISRELKNTKLVIEILSHLADTNFLSYNIPKFLKCIDSILQISENTSNSYSLMLKYLHLGNKYHLFNDTFKSIHYYKKSLKLCNKMNDKILKTNILNRIGVSFYRIGRFSEAIEHLRESLDVCLNHDSKPNLGCAHGYLGSAYSMAGKFKDAIPHLEKSIEILKETKLQIPGALFLNELGCVHLDTGKKNESLYLFEKALKISITKKDKNLEALCLLNLSNYHIRETNFDTAHDLLKKSLSIANESYNVFSKLGVFNALGVLFTGMGKHKKAQKYFEECRVISYNLENILGQCRSLYGLGKSHLLCGNIFKAKEYL